MHIFLKDLLKNLSTVIINDSFYAMTGTDQSTVQQTWILQSASTHGRILHLHLIMCCFAFLFLATALFQKNMMEGIRYILSIMHSARHFMTSEKIYQRGENANLWKTSGHSYGLSIYHLAQFQQSVTLLLKMYTKITYANLFCTINFICLGFCGKRINLCKYKDQKSGFFFQ